MNNNYNLCKMRRKKFYICIIILIVISIYYIDKPFEPDETSCPACYGEDFCDPILQNDYEMKSHSSWKLVNWILNVKNVYYISHENKDYVMKKLAHDSELLKFNNDLCETAFSQSACDIQKAWKQILQNHKNNVSLLIEKSASLFAEVEILKCRHPVVLDFLSRKHREIDKTADSLQHFLTILSVNPEPLMLQAFKEHNFFPKLIGTCGRTIVESYEGLPLSSYYYADWYQRASLALQLLNIAVTLSSQRIKMYLTDTSADNFAVNSGVVKLIDLENLVLVDSLHPGLEKNEHMNEGLGCSDCLSFTYDSLCTHEKSDHNYFAICKGLLSPNAFSPSMHNGLLHDIPEIVALKYPDLPKLIQSCAHPTENIRSKSAQMLIRTIQEIVPL